MEECDPMLECSLTFKRLTSTAFVPYSEMLKRFEEKSQANKAEAVFLANFRGKDAKYRTAGSQHTISLMFPLSTVSSTSPPFGLHRQAKVFRLNHTSCSSIYRHAVKWRETQVKGAHLAIHPLDMSSKSIGKEMKHQAEN
ncbi:hypothetical protein H1C71_014992 [Ictidomys tridecemlineatus]|nr:hypothetical protein H1C71_014992 [Ictidomys tridecemlineatus]KAG3293425.1 hypothetical protein H1C71_014992 [Ictidomys tridecemlineatus]KAG3293426.1 hypothetical protein H1C71_014992 [Ictidomys tridecemlineatus]